MEQEQNGKSQKLSKLQTPQMADSPLAILENGFPAYPVNVKPTESDILISEEQINEILTSIGN
ncbi:hypothetical protein KW795_00745 [Candidatus Microgenomates bacterium]|nr:hypothetical protein [Candidatus Microgenomates bacterium]